MATFNATINGETFTLETDDKPCVTWKDEGDIGPCVFWPKGQLVRVRDSDGIVLSGLPYRAVRVRGDPPLMDENNLPLVWEIESLDTRQGAQALAREKRVPFVEVFSIISIMKRVPFVEV